MLKRLLWLALLASALLLLLGLLTAQAEAPYRPAGAIAPQAALPAESGQAPAPAARPAEKDDAAPPETAEGTARQAPEAPAARAAYHRRLFAAFHYSDKAG